METVGVAMLRQQLKLTIDTRSVVISIEMVVSVVVCIDVLVIVALEVNVAKMVADIMTAAMTTAEAMARQISPGPMSIPWFSLLPDCLGFSPFSRKDCVMPNYPWLTSVQKSAREQSFSLCSPRSATTPPPTPRRQHSCGPPVSFRQSR